MTFTNDDQRKAVMSKLNNGKGISIRSIKSGSINPNTSTGNKMIQRTSRVIKRHFSSDNYKDLPNQAPYEFRDGLIEPTKENPSANYFIGKITFTMLPDTKTTKSRAICNKIEILSKNKLRLLGDTKESSLPYVGVNDVRDKDKLVSYSGRDVFGDEIILIKNNNDEFDIESNSLWTEIRVVPKKAKVNNLD